jgi:hypothetical protein
MSYPQAYGDYEDTGLGKFKLKKILKKIASPVSKTIQKVTAKGPLKTVKKIIRKHAAISVGLATAGLVKPKFVGIKQKGSKKLYRYAGHVSKVAAVVAAAVVAAPAVSAALGGSTAASGASAGSIVSAGTATGVVTPSLIATISQNIPGINTQEIPGIVDALMGKPPANISEPTRGIENNAGGNFMDTMKPYLPWIIGVVLVAVVVPPLLRKGR